MEFYFPTEFGEQLAFGAAAFSALMGFAVMFAPGMSLSFFGLQPKDGRREGLVQARASGGFMLGVSLSALLLAQPMLYLAFGAAMALAAFARLVGMMSDGGNVVQNLLLMIVQIALAALPLGYFMGFF